MTELRFQGPGFWTLVVHFLMLVALIICLTPLMALRLIVAPLAELLIRATDDLRDALAERLEL